MRLSSVVIVSVLLGICSLGGAQSAAEILERIAKAQDQVKGFRAEVEIRESGMGAEDTSTRTLSISRDFGWRMEQQDGPAPFLVVNNFKTSYQYFPKDRIARRDTAETAELQEAYRKPVTEMNSTALLDPESIKVIGTEQFEGTEVFHLEGTTSTQVLAQGKPVTRKMELWVGVNDGIPRKTIEHVEDSVGTTIYRNVELNPDFSEKDFTFTPPSDVTVIDGSAERRNMLRARATQSTGSLRKN